MSRMSSDDDSTAGGIAFLGLLAVIATLLLISFLGGCMPHYSDGQRTGVVTNISHKGFAFRSWEGSLNLGGASANSNGTLVLNAWKFSVQSDEVAHQIEAAAKQAKRVTLAYHQYALGPMSIDTKYVVDSATIELAEESK